VARRSNDRFGFEAVAITFVNPLTQISTTGLLCYAWLTTTGSAKSIRCRLLTVCGGDSFGAGLIAAIAYEL
jgi:hypothetical protein